MLDLNKAALARHLQPWHVVESDTRVGVNLPLSLLHGLYMGTGVPRTWVDLEAKPAESE